MNQDRNITEDKKHVTSPNKAYGSRCPLSRHVTLITIIKFVSIKLGQLRT